MSTKYLTPAQQEIRAALNEADEISQRSEITKRDESRLAYLFAKVKAVSNANGVVTGSECQRFFAQFLKTGEVRQLQEGQQTLTYSAGAEGGYLVPQAFHDEVIHGMAQFDPLLNKDVVTLIESGDGSLKPYTIPGWDLSTFAATKVAENIQQVGGVPPTVSGTILNGYKYSASLPASIEIEEDAFQPMQALIQQAYSIGFARGIGVDLAIGNGTTAPQGVLTGAADSGVTCEASNSVDLNDIENVYFKVNRFHRASPKCAWLMNDATYQLVRKAHDSVGNPLLKVIKDKEVLMDKPVLISPSLPTYNPSLGIQAPGSFCVFGDLSHVFVRVSRLSVQRLWQLPGYVENGMALYKGVMRADAKVFDPTSGGTAPIVSARLKS